MQKITTFLWFDTQAEEAAKFYTSLFKNSKILSTTPGPDGKVMVVVFELEGLQFMALNGGPEFKFSEAMSLYVDCQDQAEVDWFWDKLTADGGETSQCGWLKDKYGLSWQVVPEALPRLMQGPKGGQVMQAMLKMQKIIVADLETAAK